MEISEEDLIKRWRDNRMIGRFCKCEENKGKKKWDNVRNYGRRKDWRGDWRWKWKWREDRDRE